jgi:hypothetical protein
MRRDGLVEALRRGDVGDADPEVVDPAALSHRAVVHGFGAVPVRVEEERAVVVVAVLRAQAGRAIVAVAGVGAGAPELVHALTRRRDERDVEPPRHRLLFVGPREREVVPLRVCRLLDAERPQHGLVEALRRLAVRDTNRDVVEHAPTIAEPD